MAWMMDTYSQQKGYAVPGVVTGKPVEIGGSLGRREATGRGVIACMQEACRGLDLRQPRVAIQGFGNVGQAAAQIAHDLNCCIVAVSDVKGGIYCDTGLDIQSVIAHVEENDYLEGFPGAEPITNSELLELPCEVLIPAALQNQISEENADRLRCRLVVEGANGPTSLEADAVLRDRGIFVVPDILANAGGVTVSYFEWIQSSQRLFWTAEEVNSKLITLMQRAYQQVHETAESHKVDMRSAALRLGIRRIAEAKRTRGVFP
jgi:glutamate dehydrogenase/leucine dehydrogenase